MNKQDLQITSQSIARASNVCAKLAQMVSPMSQEQRAALIKCNGQDQMFDNPVDSVMEEEAISQSSPAFMALAAFVGEAVEGIQNALKIQEAKLDAILEYLANDSKDIVKANQDTIDLLKASLRETPLEKFTPQRPLTKAQQTHRIGTEGTLQIPKSFIINQLEKMVQEGKATVVELSQVEAGGSLRQDLREIIEATWRETH